MGLLSWIIFGALAGWVASILTGTDKQRGCLGNILVGVVGAFLGGIIIEFLLGVQVHFGWDWRSFGVAVLGACLLLAITGSGRKKQ